MPRDSGHSVRSSQLLYIDFFQGQRPIGAYGGNPRGSHRQMQLAGHIGSVTVKFEHKFFRCTSHLYVKVFPFNPA